MAKCQNEHENKSLGPPRPPRAKVPYQQKKCLTVNRREIMSLCSWEVISQMALNGIWCWSESSSGEYNTDDHMWIYSCTECLSKYLRAWQQENFIWPKVHCMDLWRVLLRIYKSKTANGCKSRVAANMKTVISFIRIFHKNAPHSVRIFFVKPPS